MSKITESNESEASPKKIRYSQYHSIQELSTPNYKQKQIVLDVTNSKQPTNIKRDLPIVKMGGRGECNTDVDWLDLSARIKTRQEDPFKEELSSEEEILGSLNYSENSRSSAPNSPSDDTQTRNCRISAKGRRKQFQPKQVEFNRVNNDESDSDDLGRIPTNLREDKNCQRDFENIKKHLKDMHKDCDNFDFYSFLRKLNNHAALGPIDDCFKNFLWKFLKNDDLGYCAFDFENLFATQNIAAIFKSEIMNNLEALIDKLVNRIVDKFKDNYSNLLKISRRNDAANLQVNSPFTLDEIDERRMMRDVAFPHLLTAHDNASYSNRSQVSSSLYARLYHPTFLHNYQVLGANCTPSHLFGRFANPVSVSNRSEYLNDGKEQSTKKLYKDPEQTEAMALVVTAANKRKRTKVTDTRMSPRATKVLLNEDDVNQNFKVEQNFKSPKFNSAGDLSHRESNVAASNDHNQRNIFLANFDYNKIDRSEFLENMYAEQRNNCGPTKKLTFSNSYEMLTHSEDHLKFCDPIKRDIAQSTFPEHLMTSTLTPMHLRKAKLMFFYVRYPSSNVLKVYFPDVKFNKNNTAQLIKWFSNFREFFYIQMEKYARQALADGQVNASQIFVTTDSEIYKVLVLHYNRNNRIEVTENFRLTVQATLREFFKSIQAEKDQEQSWKKAIYKIIQRLDDTVPEYFKSPNWMQLLADN